MLCFPIMVVCTRCQQPAKETTKNTTELIVETSEAFDNSYTISEIIDTSSVSFVALEATQDILGSVDELLITENEIIVLDKNTKKVWIFDSSGKFLTQIDAQGRGPHEYVNIHTIAYKEPDMLGILDDSQKNIVWYNTTGEFLNKDALPYYACDIFEQSEQMHVMYRYIPDNAPASEKLYYHIYKNSLSNSKAFFPYNSFGIYSNIEDPFFMENDTNLLIRNPFNTKLYSIIDGDLKVKFDFNFKKPTFPFHKYKDKNNADVISTRRKEGEYQGDIMNVIFTSTHLTLRYIEHERGKSDLLNLVYDKKNKGLMAFSGSDFDSSFKMYYKHPKASYGNYFFSVLHPYTLQDKIIKKLGISGNVESANPVIMRFQYKDIFN